MSLPQQALAKSLYLQCLFLLGCGWWLYKYKGERFPGEITAVSYDIEESAMHRSGNKIMYV